MKSTEKTNTRLVRAAEYTSRFELDIRHKPGSQNVVPDAFSRLEGKDLHEKSYYGLGELGVLHQYSFSATFVEISLEFRKDILKGYEDTSWRGIKDNIQQNDKVLLWIICGNLYLLTT